MTGNCGTKLSTNNILDFTAENVNMGSQNIPTITYLSSGYRVIDNSSNSGSAYINIPIDDFVTPGNSYTLKAEFEINEGASIFLQKTGGDYSKQLTTSGTKTNIADTNSMNVLITVDSGKIVKVRLSAFIGETASDYTLHAEQNAPLTLGNIEAYEGDEIQIDFVQKAGYKKVTGARLVQNMGEYDFTGEETFTKSTSTNNVAFYTAMFSPQIKAADSNNYAVLMYSNCFISYSANKIFSQDVAGVSVSTTKNVQFGLGANSEITTVEAFQQMLAQKNVSLVYPLETPTTTPITDSTLLAQLETLINMKTYKEVTNIALTGEDLAPILDCYYYQDMSTVKSDIASIKARLDLLEE